MHTLPPVGTVSPGGVLRNLPRQTVEAETLRHSNHTDRVRKRRADPHSGDTDGDRYCPFLLYRQRTVRQTLIIRVLEEV